MRKFRVYNGSNNPVAIADAFEVLAGGVLKIWDETPLGKNGALGVSIALDSISLYAPGAWSEVHFEEVS